MPITVVQGFQFGDLDSQKGATTWLAQCTPTAGVWPTQSEVRAAVLAAAPTTYSGLIFDDVKVSHITDAIYLAEATYKRFDSPPNKEQEAEGYVLDFDTTGETQHMTTSLDHRNYAGTDPVVDCQGAIGYDGEKVKGIDIVTGVYRFSEEWNLPATTVTAAWRKSMKDLTGKVNNATFRTFAAGEVRFDGVTGRRIKGALFSVTFRFAVSTNASNLNKGGITVTTKAGWEYLDVLFKDDVSGQSVVQVPKQVTVHKVYELASFSIFPSA